jgi:non-specific serine/threonine protein kinase
LLDQGLSTVTTAPLEQGRICFHLAENKGDESYPFAFLATYAKQMFGNGKIQHTLLSKMVQEQSEGSSKEQLLSLLLPLQKASQESPFLSDLMESRKIFHPQAWTPKETYEFLKDIPIFEKFDLMIRVPDWYTKKPLRPMVSLKIGNDKPSEVGLDALMSFDVKVSLDGESISEEEWTQLAESNDGLAFIRGRWVEMDSTKLQDVLTHWRNVKKEMQGGVGFIEAMRIINGIHPQFSNKISATDSIDIREWTHLNPGKWLIEVLNSLRSPDGLKKLNLQESLQGTLRPYQENGLKWLWYLYSLKLGACLADDMGLGKTIQVLSLLLVIKNSNTKNHNKKPSLLIAPASLLGNWCAEACSFAPSLRIKILHPSEKTYDSTCLVKNNVHDYDLYITSYGFSSRIKGLTKTDWDMLILDEAQAIKNSGTKQTQFVKKLKSRHRIALTGTPIENRLEDLWSLFDFLNPGLLGNSQAFKEYIKSQKNDVDSEAYSSLRNLVKPYILRRMKTDKDIIPDLPDKIEMKTRCYLTKAQAVLYSESVDLLRRKLETAEGIQRCGLVLSFLMRFKQICNHPSHWLSDGVYNPKHSGKFLRLQELVEEIASRQEKVLVFTQFREITTVLEETLSVIFKRRGLILHGQTPVKKRKDLVAEFQQENGPPFFILSLKAGGTGLNLTAATHVIHFDRWWNPAVENQASDRAFRIGQKRNVLIHKFMCVGTVEERIDKMISDKQSLAGSVLEGGLEKSLTDLSNDELMSMVSLDLNAVIE